MKFSFWNAFFGQALWSALSVSYERNPVVEKIDPFDSLELCYGTANGTVRVLVQSPEHNTYGRSLQLLQTYKGIECQTSHWKKSLLRKY